MFARSRGSRPCLDSLSGGFALFLHGDDAEKHSQILHPLTLQFQGPRCHQLSWAFHLDRCKRIKHGHKVTVPFATLALVVIYLVSAGNWSSDMQLRKTMSLGAILVTLGISWLARACLHKDASKNSWNVHVCLMWFVLSTAVAFFDDSSGPVLQGWMDQQHHHRMTSLPWQWLISGLLFLNVSSAFPVHPLAVFTCSCWHLISVSVFLAICDSEMAEMGEQTHWLNFLGHLGHLDLVLLVAVAETSLVSSRYRSEFQEKVGFTSGKFLLETKAQLEAEKKIMHKFTSYAFDAYAWLDQKGDLVLEDPESHNGHGAKMLREMSVEEVIRSGDAEQLHFRDWLATSQEQSRFEIQIASLLHNSQNAENQPDEDCEVVLLNTMISKYEPSSMKNEVQKASLFLLKAPTILSKASGKGFLVGIKLKETEPDEVAERRSRTEPALSHGWSWVKQGLSAEENERLEKVQENNASGQDVSNEILSDLESMQSSGWLVEAAVQDRLSWDAAVNAMTRRADEERWLLHKHQVTVHQGMLLGEGGHGKVVKASFLGNPVALKLARPDSTQQDGNISTFQAAILNEIRLLRNLRHPNICRFYGIVRIASTTSSSAGIGLVTELVVGGDLREFVSDMLPRPTGKDKYQALVDISSALVFLHESDLPVVHGDVKPSNIMVSRSMGGQPTAKFIDFGLARAREEFVQILGGSIRWKAPEVQRGKRPRKESDIFSFGYLAYFCFSEKYPWADNSADEIKQASKHSTAPIHDLENTRVLPLVQQMLQMEIVDRPKASLVHSQLMELMTRQAPL